MAESFMVIGPAHPSHPDHLKYYTKDGVDRRAPDAEAQTLDFVGYGEEARLITRAKTAAELEADKIADDLRYIAGKIGGCLIESPDETTYPHAAAVITLGEGEAMHILEFLPEDAIIDQEKGVAA